MTLNIQLSIVLPCYNEADNLPLILAGYAKAWRADMAAELILVNNGSTDHSAEVLQRELANPDYAFARSVLVEENQGYGHGIFTGLQAARGEFLAFSHADMQCARRRLRRLGSAAGDAGAAPRTGERPPALAQGPAPHSSPAA